MKAVQFHTTIPRFVVGKLAGAVARSAYTTRGVGSTRLVDVPVPELPGPRWALIRTRMGGICGSDLHTIFLESSPSTSPFASFPFTFGHENVGVVERAGPEVRGAAPGQRVVVDPVLGCEVRGIEPPCPACRRGDYQLCERFTDGALSPGMLTGTCRDTGGSWGEYFLAHDSQLIPVPDSLSDEAALMAEPFAVALHPVLRFPARSGETVLVIGAGTVGLAVVAALRATGSPGRVVVAARHAHQAEAARRLGADLVVTARGPRLYPALAEALGARLLRPIIGKPVPVGGADLTFECVGTGPSIDDALRFTRAGGRVVLVGLASTPRNVDWSPIWLKELQVQGTFCYGVERLPGGRRIRTMAYALELMEQGKADLGSLVTHRFPLESWREAIQAAARKGPSGAVKVALVP
ncbi:alcohol dehydrogenase catalytic domain-containing protein [Carboxydochorda subterranea]|uniref:Alcohol dehydrogenase catalytic domain-containing protein n=1 Tax=Carboxydichorda subterranea TaxID=3109565 RepID=A0ABZ1BY28_9FIRM|nr:alcohol dehydrogenase catalytic domain-containing protein [Limnochorda sp. L945t]WRP17618.1 alcohol dehydrogenase catalytic domain-containing protein [Limnochorda sp. L945t]